MVQQLRSLSQLHVRELDELADELDAAGFPKLSQRLRTFRGLHLDETSLVVDELEDLVAALTRRDESVPGDMDQARPADQTDPAAQSPKRARWLEEQARRATQPLSRREVFSLRREKGPD